MTVRREVSPAGYYHITSRGVGGMALFEDDDDRRFYLRLLKKYRNECSLKVLAWVLMDNHTHLILDTGEEGLPTEFMRKLNTTYAMYFNDRTQHVGHVFQGDYHSIPICTDSQLMATIDYIHRNPERARIATMDEYRWSSYQEYAGKTWVVDTSVALALFGSFSGMSQFVARAQDIAYDRKTRRTATDSEAVATAMALAGVRTSGELRGLPKPQRDALVRRLGLEGFRGTQIGRVLGLGKSTVYGILKAPVIRD